MKMERGKDKRGLFFAKKGGRFGEIQPESTVGLETQKGGDQTLPALSREGNTTIQTWCLDSRCTTHLSPHLDWMENVMPYESEINLAEEGKVTHATAKGDIKVSTCTENGIENFQIKGVLHVPNLKAQIQDRMYVMETRSRDEYSEKTENVMTTKDDFSNDNISLWHRRLNHLRSVHERDNSTECVDQNTFLFWLNDFSRRTFIYFLKNKGETLGKFEEFKARVENELNLKIKDVRTDNGTEFTNHRFKNFLIKNGIHQLSTTYSPQSQSSLKHQWRNGKEENPPFDISEYSVVWRFWPITQQPRSKFMPKSRKGIFVGYSLKRKAYRVYDIITKKIEEVRSAKFVENEKGIDYAKNLQEDTNYDHFSYKKEEEDDIEIDHRTRPETSELNEETIPTLDEPNEERIVRSGRKKGDTQEVLEEKHRAKLREGEMKLLEQGLCTPEKQIHLTLEKEINDFVDEKERELFAIKDAKAKYTLVQCLTDKHLDIIKDAKTAKEMMKALEIIFERKSVLTKLTLKRKLLTLKCKHNEKLEDHFLKFDSIIRELDNIGSKMDESDKICHLLLSLNEEYENVITAIETINTEIKMEFVKARLLDEELKRKKKQGEPRNEEMTFGSFTFTCYNCGQKGEKSNIKPIDTKWIFRTKEDGTKKARLVAKGFQMEESSDIMYAPVARMSTIRMLLSHATNKNWEVNQMKLSNMGAKEAIWLGQTLPDLGFISHFAKPLTIYCDNRSAIDFSKNNIDNNRSKHISVQFHYTRDKINSGDIVVQFVNTKENMADIQNQDFKEVDAQRCMFPDEFVVAIGGMLNCVLPSNMHIADSQIVHVKNLLTAKATWDTLKNIYERKTLSGKIYLLRKLYSLKLEEDKDMQQHITTMMEIIDKLRTIGETLKDSQITAILLCSLPKSYSNLITMLESRPDDELTLEFTKNKLLDEHTRRVESSKDESTGSKALKSLHEASSQRREKEKKFCSFCHKPNHSKEECWHYQKRNNSNKEYKYENFRRGNVPKYTNQSSVTLEQPTNQRTTKGPNPKALNRTQREASVHNWFVDSGATSHMAYDESFFTELNREQTQNVVVANGNKLQVKGIGQGEIKVITPQGKTDTLLLTKVLYIPELTDNLLSVSAATSNGCKVTFNRDWCTIERDNTALANGILDNGMYRLHLDDNPQTRTFKANVAKQNHCRNKNCLMLWHDRLGHRNIESIKKIHNENLARGLSLNNCSHSTDCVQCIQGNLTETPFPKKTEYRATETLQLVHSDICGPLPTNSLSGKRYFITFTDDYSRYTKVYLLKGKDEAYEKIKDYVISAHTEFGKNIQTIRTDNGSEYVNRQVDFLNQSGIKHQLTVPYSPAQNGVAERKNRSLMEMTRCMLFDSGLPQSQWAEAVTTANYLHNRIPSKATDKTPFELWTNRKPSLKHLRRFGCKAFAYIPKIKRNKLDSKVIEGIFLGYDDRSKGYRILHDTDNITISRYVKFIEKENGFHHASTKTTSPQVLSTDLTFSNHIGNAEESQEPGTQPENLEDSETEDYLQPSTSTGTQVVTQRRSTRPTKGIPPIRNDYMLYKTEAQDIQTPIVKHSTIRAFLAASVYKGMKVNHLDVKTAFLHGDLDKELYMELPEGLHTKQTNKVCNLKKEIYGLKQAGRSWNTKIASTLIKNNFKQSIVDPCLFTKNEENHSIYLILYVDDMLLASDSEIIIQNTVKTLEKEFEIKNLGDPTQFIGIEISRNREGELLLSQKNKIQELVERYNLQEAKPTFTPMESGYPGISDEKLLPNNVQYQQLIGSLLYLSVVSRPDIAAPVCILSSRNQNPRNCDWNAAKRIVRYLKTTKELELRISNQKPPTLEAYSDATWASDNTDRKSLSGNLFLLGSNPISWMTGKQGCVSLSSTEAELISAAEASQELLWLLDLLKDLEMEQKAPIYFHQDNQSCLKICSSEKVSSRTKHIATKIHHLKDLQKKTVIKMIYCPTGDMKADILTKPLPRPTFEKLRYNLVMSPHSCRGFVG
ncbi:hypothetical protein LAZ67_10002666 [Cordylochernes scorpioides]|uniref:Integrase catalytic domain-containing protein n=1 Tax=Cordylochernes scorpioides TaxID=51811 RepID=A0ABY6KXF5_9ARAC|nr:hypothetical protein LAZ67_10002666 [Cordylochernes scorpioides]